MFFASEMSPKSIVDIAISCPGCPGCAPYCACHCTVMGVPVADSAYAAAAGSYFSKGAFIVNSSFEGGYQTPA